MYLLIGLKEDGRMQYYGGTRARPTDDEVKEAARDFSYTQLLVLDTDRSSPFTLQTARYEYMVAPALVKVECA